MLSAMQSRQDSRTQFRAHALRTAGFARILLEFVRPRVLQSRPSYVNSSVATEIEVSDSLVGWI